VRNARASRGFFATQGSGRNRACPCKWRPGGKKPPRMSSGTALSNDGWRPNSGGAQVDRLGALAHAVGLDVEGHLLAVDEGAQAGRLDGGNVDEHVLGAAVRRDKSETLGRVEEFYGPGLGHEGELLSHSVSLRLCRSHSFAVVQKSRCRGKGPE